MVSRADVLDLLQKEANMSGYGMDFECPHCEGSGLIGGFAGQKDIYSRINDVPLTAAQRKEQKAAIFAALASDKEKARRVKKTPAQKLAAAQRIIERQGQTSARGLKKAENIVRAMKLLEEMKLA